jgi:hypothetical protein
MRLPTVLFASLVAGLASFPTAAAATPSPVSASYVYGTTPAALGSYAYARGCDFAKAQPGTGVRILLLDFGAARKLNSATWGAVDFSNTTLVGPELACFGC